MGSLLDIAGLAGSFVGIVTISRYGLPYRLPPLQKLMRVMTEAEASEDDRRNLIGCGGITLLTLGTAFQILAVLAR